MPINEIKKEIRNLDISEKYELVAYINELIEIDYDKGEQIDESDF